MSVLKKLGRMVGKGVSAMAPKVREKAIEVAKTYGPSPEQVVAGAEKAVDKLRERNPELMAKVSSVATSAVGKMGKVVPSVVQRASSMVDEARDKTTDAHEQPGQPK